MLVCHHDYTSPASALAVLRLQRIADEGGHVAFSGIDVLGIDATIPATLDQFAEIDAVRERAAALGLAMTRPRWRPPTLRAHLVGELAGSAGLGAVWREGVLTAYWQDGADLADEAVLLAIAVDAGLDGAEVGGLLADRPAAVRLRQRMARTRRGGVGGVPVLEFDGTLVPADLADDDLRRLVAA